MCAASAVVATIRQTRRALAATRGKTSRYLFFWNRTRAAALPTEQGASDGDFRTISSFGSGCESLRFGRNVCWNGTMAGMGIHDSALSQSHASADEKVTEQLFALTVG